MKTALARIFAAGVWINVSEFFRNEIVLKPRWIEHFRTIGQPFPSEPRNAALWIVWGFLLATLIHTLDARSKPFFTGAISWVFAFPLMWIVAWNLGVFPLSILPAAIPLSVVEIFVAVAIMRRIGTPSRPQSGHRG